MKFKIALLFGFFCFTSMVMAQSKYIVKAETAFASENYCKGAELCASAYSRLTRKGKSAKKRKAEMAFKTAECFRMTERFREANEWFDRAILLEYYNTEPEVYLYNGRMLQMMAEFEKAVENYEEYLKLVPDDARALVGIKSCDANKVYIAEKTRHIIENQSALNKRQFDMSPVFGDRKMSKLYFGSGREESTGNDTDPRTCEGYMDIWVSDMDKKGNWTEPYLVKGEAINTVDSEGTLCFDSRFKKMFFTRCPNLKKTNLGCDIWVSEAKGKTEWKEPTKINIKSHDSVSVGHPCTADGKYLIFASDMSGGYGGRDLWYTLYDKKTDSWSAPKNMGPEINTKGNELFPTFALNGDLIFASDGFKGMGGLDIFRATKIGENKWENPTNLGAPVNSINNDYSYVEKDAKMGFFTSDRKSNNGEFTPDIYSYVLPPNVFDLKVTVTELGGNNVKIEDVQVVVTAADGNKWEGFTDENGSVFWDKKPSGERFINEEVSYTINISKDGYHEDKNGTTFSTEGLDYDQNFIIDMALLPKTPIRLPEVRYPLNQWTLLVDSTINSPDSLLFVFEILEEYPGLLLELSSHTDSRGNNRANQKLSENRAKACYKYLVEEKGVDPRRIVPVGKGEESPRTIWKNEAGEYLAAKPNNMEGIEEIVLTEAYINKFRRSDKITFELLHQYNRRAEGKVISMDFNPETAEDANPEHLKFVKYP